MPGTEDLEISKGDALIIVDVQNDFLPGGALAVNDGDAVIPVINKFMRVFTTNELPIFATRDWQPSGHCSFVDYGGPWPNHCVANSPGAQIAEELALPDDVTIVHKGTDVDEEGIVIKAVRLDSGDIIDLSVSIRRILDEGGCGDIALFASGDLDEYRLAGLLGHGCPIDGFGIGTRLTISEDSPSLDCVYKLQEYAGQARRKRSTGKTTWPGRKQVYRRRRADGCFDGDLLTLASDACDDGEALIVPMMRNGKRIKPVEILESIRERTIAQLASLPDHLKALAVSPQRYPVKKSPELKDLAEQVDRHFA